GNTLDSNDNNKLPPKRAPPPVPVRSSVPSNKNTAPGGSAINDVRKRPILDSMTAPSPGRAEISPKQLSSPGLDNNMISKGSPTEVSPLQEVQIIVTFII